jgi:glycosyltransferase involved in cell wall biosynthesis
MALSAVILTHNSEKTLERCLQSLLFVDELVVTDDNSTDATLQIAQKYTQNIIQHSVNNDFAAQRNWVMGQTKNEWVLFIDSDEILSQELQNELKKMAFQQQNQITCYRLKRHDTFMGTSVTHGEVSDAAQKGIIRLVRKGTGSWKGQVHEMWTVASGTEGRLINALRHEPHPTVALFLKKINTYSTIRAKELFSKKQTVSWFHLLLYPIGKFLYTYFLKMGFLDGPSGFIYSFMMSFHSFLVRAKLYQYYLDAQPVPTKNHQ